MRLLQQHDACSIRPARSVGWLGALPWSWSWQADLDLSEQEFDRVIHVNLHGCLSCASLWQHRAGQWSDGERRPHLVDRRGFDVSEPGCWPSKMAATQLMNSFPWNGADTASGPTPSLRLHEPHDQSTADRYSGEDVDQWVTRMTPMGRRGDTEELLGADHFLSDASSFTTGQVLAVDGGHNHLALTRVLPSGFRPFRTPFDQRYLPRSASPHKRTPLPRFSAAFFCMGGRST